MEYRLPLRLNLYCKRCDTQHWFYYRRSRKLYVSPKQPVAVVAAPESLLSGAGKTVGVDGCGYTIHPLTVLVTYESDEMDGSVGLPRHVTRGVEA
jgi:hypothetical protein